MHRRRVLEEDAVSHERWLVSYADFITLLFAFFVVMYSISQVNQGKYKVLSETLTEAFSTSTFTETPRTLDPFQIGELVKSNPQNPVDLETPVILELNDEMQQELIPEEEAGEGPATAEGGLPTEFEQINTAIEESLGDLLQENLITVRGNEEWLELELKSSLLFSSGDAELSNSALELLGGIADLLKGADNPIRVEGFTDNVPINTSQFPSNWELSTARASAVVQLFVEEGLNPSRLAAIGYGEHQPIAENITAEGRAENRRVVLMISKTGELRPELRTAASTEELERQAELNTQQGIEIIIPGVEPASAPEPVEPVAEEPKDPMEGIRTIELEDGGLLFTNESADAPDQ